MICPIIVDIKTESFTSCLILNSQYSSPLGLNPTRTRSSRLHLSALPVTIDENGTAVAVTAAASVIAIRVFKNAFLCSASGIICVHNHPSGDVTPSREDIHFTESLVEIGTLSGIPVLDHIIVGDDSYYSFFDEGKIINL